MTRRSKKEFKITTEYGDKLPYEWFANAVKRYAKEKYGLNLEVKINPKYLSELKKSEEELHEKSEVSVHQR